MSNDRSDEAPPSQASSQPSARTRRQAGRSGSSATARAYRADWKDFEDWCIDHGVPSIPTSPNTVLLYLEDAGRRLKPATLERRCSAIAFAHRAKGFDSPTSRPVVRAALTAIRSSVEESRTRTQPTLIETLRVMARSAPENPAGYRDRAAILIGFAGALRRSELVRLDVEDLTFTENGLEIQLRESAGVNKETATRVSIPFGPEPEICPVTALSIWLSTSRIDEGPVFRPVDRFGRIQPRRLTDRSIALIVKRLAEAAGLDPSVYSAHSLRAGFATQALQDGVPDRTVMEYTRHRSRTAFGRYDRERRLIPERQEDKDQD